MTEYIRSCPSNGQYTRIKGISDATREFAFEIVAAAAGEIRNCLTEGPN